MSADSRPLRLAAVTAVLTAALLGVQAASDAAAPRAVTATGASLGRAGAAYLTGVRVFAGLVLWNRIEPVYHEYYDGLGVDRQTWTIPTIWLVVRLDPSLVEPYYDGAWMLARKGRTADALRLAREGVENNPRSGLLRTSHAQILMLYGKDVAAAAAEADRAMSGSLWADDGGVELYDSLSTIRTIYEKAGMSEKAAAVGKMLRDLDTATGGALSHPPAEED